MRDIAKWDLHHHVVPDVYRAGMAAAGVTRVGGFAFPRWSPSRSLRAMDALGTERAFLSVSAPGVCVAGVPDPALLAAQLNDVGARLVAEHPDRFGWFTTLPQCDIAACVAEVERTGSDAVVLMSSIEDVHFGHASLEPLWECLDGRQAIVYVHPSGRPGFEDNGLLNPLYLWQNDTTRTMLDFLRVGGHVRHPNIRWVLSHGGGLLPVVIDEALRALAVERPNIVAEVDAWRPHVFLDTASKAYDEQIPPILAFGGPGQVTFGTDFPWAARNAGSMIATAYARMTDRLGLDDDQIRGIFRDNAVRLFARQDQPAPRSAPRDLAAFPPYTLDVPAVRSLDPAFWSGDPADVRQRIIAHNDALDRSELGLVDMLQPEFSVAEIDRCREDLRLAGIRVPLDLSHLPGPREFVDAALIDRLAQTTDTIRIEPRITGGIPLLHENRLDAVLFCAKGQWLGRLDGIEGSRLILAETCGVIPYLAEPVNLLHYLGRGRLGLLAYVWDTYVAKRPAAVRWLRAVRRA